jgi:hypothetical protein
MNTRNFQPRIAFPVVPLSLIAMGTIILSAPAAHAQQPRQAAPSASSSKITLQDWKQAESQLKSSVTVNGVRFALPDEMEEVKQEKAADGTTDKLFISKHMLHPDTFDTKKYMIGVTVKTVPDKMFNSMDESQKLIFDDAKIQHDDFFAFLKQIGRTGVSELHDELVDTFYMAGYDPRATFGKKSTAIYVEKHVSPEGIYGSIFNGNGTISNFISSTTCCIYLSDRKTKSFYQVRIGGGPSPLGLAYIISGLIKRV